jgi:RHS repeat-associated protein
MQAWRAISEAFGDTKVDTGSTIAMNLRFAGQYFDVESGLHQNYFRDYKPGAGRYIQRDPVGLRGGVNSFVYVGGNPLKYIDPKGLLRICSVLTGRCVETNPISIDPELSPPPPFTFPNPIRPIINFINRCLDDVSKDCDAERERAEEYCGRLYSSGYTPDRAGRRIGGKRFNQCVQGQVSEACGGNKVE